LAAEAEKELGDKFQKTNTQAKRVIDAFQAVGIKKLSLQMMSLGYGYCLKLKNGLLNDSKLVTGECGKSGLLFNLNRQDKSLRLFSDAERAVGICNAIDVHFESGKPLMLVGQQLDNLYMLSQSENVDDDSRRKMITHGKFV
jgi:hypothetical protein